MPNAPHSGVARKNGSIFGVTHSDRIGTLEETELVPLLPSPQDKDVPDYRRMNPDAVVL